MGTARIHVIGLGVGAGMRLSAPAEKALKAAHTVIGSNRQLEMAKVYLVDDGANRRELPKLSELKALIEELPDGEVVVLASGDPLYFGIGRWLGQRFEAGRLRFYPAVSSLQALCHRYGVALQDCEVVSLHGRPPSDINRVLKRNRNLLVLTDQHSHPRALAEACIRAGFAQSRIYIGENIGADGERFRESAVLDVAESDNFECSDLHVSLLQTRGPGGVLPEFPGIDDHSFATDAASGQGMFTKREVRLAILALLQPGNGDVIWDVGAGCGGVATELTHWNPRVSVYAIEQNATRLACLAQNRERFGCVANLNIVEGRAPAAFAGLPAANKVFVGGSDGELETILAECWQGLPRGGLLVASAVTESSRQRLQSFALASADAVTELRQLAVSHGQVENTGIALTAKLPVTLFRFEKKEAES